MNESPTRKSQSINSNYRYFRFYYKSLGDNYLIYIYNDRNFEIEVSASFELINSPFFT